MAITLRDYQRQCLDVIASERAAGTLRQVVHLPTAAGKTVIFASLIAKAVRLDPSTRALILAFSTELLGQARDKLLMIAPSLDVGILDADHKELDRQVVVSSIQSARQPGNLDLLRAQGFSIAICDEAHHFASDSAWLVLNELGFSKEGCAVENRLLVGFSATPFRSDDKGLGEVFDRIVYYKSIKEMIGQGYLCPPKGHKVITDIDFSKIAVESGDFSPSALSQVMNTDPVNQTVVSSYLEKAAGRKAIAFTTSIEHASRLAECFHRFGVEAAAIHSNLPMAEKEALKQRFRGGDIDVLTNPLMLCEGYDEPSIAAVVIARPTRSPGLYQQMVGRGLRLFPGKQDCAILDFSDQHHTLQNVGTLLGDGLVRERRSELHKNERVEGLIKGLPPNINSKLKRAILELDLLGDSFTWQKAFDGNYFLKGSGDAILRIIKRAEDRYDVIFLSLREDTIIVSGLDFSYSFSAAEDFVRANRALFAVSDLEASWLSLPISERQKELFRSVGFKNGIDDLSRGQAAAIISSGILRRKKQSWARK